MIYIVRNSSLEVLLKVKVILIILLSKRKGCIYIELKGDNIIRIICLGRTYYELIIKKFKRCQLSGWYNPGFGIE